MFKKSLSRLLTLLLVLAIPTAVFWGVASSKWGQHQFRIQFLEPLEKNYGLTLHYHSLRMWPGSSGWVISLRDLQWAYDPSPNHSGSVALSEPIQRVKISLNPLHLLSGLKAVSRITIEGAHLGVHVSDKILTLDGVGIGLDPAGADGLLAKIESLPKADHQTWPRIILKDFHLDVTTPGAVSHVVLEGSTKKDRTLESLTLDSPTLAIVDLAANIAAFLRQVPRLAPSTGSLKWVDLFVKGELKDLKVNCSSLSACDIDANAIGLETKDEGWIPGVVGLSSQLRWRAHTLRLDLADGKTILNFPRLNSKPIEVTTKKTAVNLSVTDESLTIEMPDTQLGYNGVNAKAQALITVPLASPEDTLLSYEAEAQDTIWSKVIEILPDTVIGKKTMDWLSQNIQTGKVTAIRSHGEGKAALFKIAGEKAGFFTIDAKVSDVSLEYLKKWPELNACAGHFLMTNLAIGIDGIQCRSMGLTVSKGKVEFPDLAAKPPMIGIGFDATGSFQDSVTFLNAGPLASIPKVLQTLGVTAADQSTQIAISAALSKPKGDAKQKVSVQGTTHVNNAALETPLGLYAGKTRAVDVSYDQDGLKSLKSLLKSPFEDSWVTLQRDDSGQRLAIDVKPVMPSVSSLRASAYAIPANAPETIQGSATGLKLKNGSGVATVENLSWRLGEDSLLAVKGNGAISDFGTVAAMFGLPLFSQGKGNVTFDLSLARLGKQPVTSALGGNLDIAVKDGKIEKLPKWVATTVNAANLDSFGFHSEKVPYKTLDAQLVFAGGQLSVKKSALNVDVLEVRSEGTVDFKNDKMNLNLEFIPDLGSAPPALAVGVWNPLVGLALYGFSKLEDKASDSFLNRIVSQTYKLEGSPSDPDVHLVSPFGFKNAFR